jgi:hypothetical protein
LISRKSRGDFRQREGADRQYATVPIASPMKAKSERPPDNR